eukprot:3534030-Prymnesium_polylepis.1
MPDVILPRRTCLLSMCTHSAAWRPQADDQGHMNAAARLFTAYQVPLDARPPAWFINLARELQENASELCHHPMHRPIISELKRVDPEKARKVSSALHFVLAPYEYTFLDACLEYGQSIGLEFADDCLDGALWLTGSFPRNTPIARVFEDMTDYAQRATGMTSMVIREEVMKLPDLSVPKTRKVNINAWVDVGDAGAKAVFAYLDRHWTSIQGRSKSVGIERWFIEGTDICDEYHERTDDEHTRMYKSCKLTVTGEDGKKVTAEVAKLWLDRTERPVKEHLDFLTNEAKRQKNSEILSGFTGLPLDASTPIDYVTAASHTCVETIKNHVRRILANDNMEVYQYISNWHAWSVQKRIKSGVMLCLV